MSTVRIEFNRDNDEFEIFKLGADWSFYSDAELRHSEEQLIDAAVADLKRALGIERKA